MNKTKKIIAAAALAAALIPSVQAIPTVTLHGSSNGMTIDDVSVLGNVITITENWTYAGLGAQGVLEISGLDANVSYVVQKIINNNTGLDWTSLANELLDPDLDAADPLPQPAFVPPGYSTSNDLDGLSFDQGGSSSRSSTVFSTVVVDELTDARDFLDFTGGILAAGASDNFMTFGLRDNLGNNQPFLLIQRPNARSVETPDAGSTVALLGLGSLAMAAFGRKSKKA